jgi:hypothetical protein
VGRTKDYQKEPKKQGAKEIKDAVWKKKQTRNTIMEREITDKRDGKKERKEARNKSKTKFKTRRTERRKLIMC